MHASVWAMTSRPPRHTTLVGMADGTKLPVPCGTGIGAPRAGMMSSSVRSSVSAMVAAVPVPVTSMTRVWSVSLAVSCCCAAMNTVDDVAGCWMDGASHSMLPSLSSSNLK